MVPESVTNWRAVRRNPEAVAFGSLFLLLLAAYAWAMWITRAGYAPLGSLVSSIVEFPLSSAIKAYVLPAFLTNIVGVGLGALAYARLRNLDVRWGLPPKNRLHFAVMALLAVALLVEVTTLAGYAVFGTPVSVMSLQSPRYAPGTRLSRLAVSSFVPAVLAGIGYGVAFFGVVQQRLRDVTTPRHAIVLTPLLVGFFWETRSVVRRATQSGTPFPKVSMLLLLLVSGVAFASSLGLLYRGAFRAPVEHLLRARYVPVFAFGLFGAVLVGTSIADLPGGLVDALRLVVFGVAAYGYERTRSIWVPILVVATLPASLDFASYLETVAGLVGAP